jgi:guanine deaminase
MHPELMKLAIEMAVENARGGGGPFAAIVSRNGRVVASGVNRVAAANDPTAHAEVEAIRAACRALGSFQLTGCEVYATCEPCPMCLGAIYWARPERVYFAATSQDAAEAGFDDAFIYREIETPYGERSIAIRRIEAENATAPFRTWTDNLARTPY